LCRVCKMAEPTTKIIMQNLEISDLPKLKLWKRKNLLELLARNDRNGIFTDEQSKAEGMEQMTKKEALKTIKRIVTENN